MEDNNTLAELTLDPADWSEMAALGHRMVDDIINHLATVRSRPAWQPMPDEVRSALVAPVPFAGEGAEAAYEDFCRYVLPYPNGNIHPRFWGWVQGNGTPLGMFADMLAAAINPHMAGFNQAPALVEHQVLAWLVELMGMPAGTTGVLTSGGTMANTIGLTVARQAKAGYDVRELGVRDNSSSRLLVYCSTETHNWVQKGAELLGLGRQSLRRIAVDDAFRIDIRELRHTIARDRAAGHQPICVVGSAGTVNTGAIDDLTALAELCVQENLWFHVDGAFGSLVCLSSALRERVAGIEQADSIAFDLHKWMYLPYEVGCVLVRDSEMHRATFASTASYLTQLSRGVIAGGLPFAERGVELTRSFRALKVWMSFKAHGIDTFAQLIEQNVRQAEYLAELVEKHADLELLTPVSLNVVCFRYAPHGIDPTAVDDLNLEILLRCQESGIAVPSSTVIDGKFAIRVAIVNHRSRMEDFATLVTTVATIGGQLVAQSALGPR